MTFVDDNQSIVFILECSAKFARIAAVVIIISPAVILRHITDAAGCDEVNIWCNLLVRIFVKQGDSLFPS